MAYWDINWTQVYNQQGSKEEKTTPIDSIDCHVLIDTFTDLSEADREAMKAELHTGFMCPDTTNMDIQGNAIEGSANVKLEISPSEYGIEQGVTDATNIVTT